MPQRSSSPPRPSSSDVRPRLTRTEQAAADDRQAQTVQTGQAKTVRSPDETRPVNSEIIPDSECITDSRGQSLEPGDAVWFWRFGDRRWGIYVGGQEVVWNELSVHRLLVYKGQLQLTDPFRKVTVINPRDVRVFPPEERVRRAKSRVGTPFTEGDLSDGSDFNYWIYTGMGLNQAQSRGFRLWYWW